VQGIWSGMVIGGTMMQTLILLWVTFRTDWTKEVNARPLHALLSSDAVTAMISPSSHSRWSLRTET
jgi:hypothetical protein